MREVESFNEFTAMESRFLLLSIINIRRKNDEIAEVCPSTERAPRLLSIYNKLYKNNTFHA